MEEDVRKRIARELKEAAVESWAQVRMSSPRDEIFRVLSAFNSRICRMADALEQEVSHAAPADQEQNGESVWVEMRIAPNSPEDDMQFKTYDVFYGRLKVASFRDFSEAYAVASGLSKDSPKVSDAARSHLREETVI